MRRTDLAEAPPPETALLGYEPSTFHSADDVSAVAQGMFFSRAIRDREESSVLGAYRARLNQWGLFDTSTEAETYLQTFLSSLPPDWDEHRYTYYTTEVRALP